MNREAFTCSDCYDQFDAESKLRQYAAPSSLYFDEHTGKSRVNIVSSDKERVYFTLNRGGWMATLVESGKGFKTLESFISGCTDINELKLSPNRRYLAYQVARRLSCSSDFVGSPPTYLYIYDLKTSINYFVTQAYGEVHWNSRSNRLYFYEAYKMNYIDVDLPPSIVTLILKKIQHMAD
jgi:hypothetical protein